MFSVTWKLRFKHYIGEHQASKVKGVTIGYTCSAVYEIIIVCTCRILIGIIFFFGEFYVDKNGK